MQSANFEQPTSVDQHRQKAEQKLNFAVITVSDTRTLENDTSGALLLEALTQAGHSLVFRTIVKDEPDQISGVIRRLIGRPGLDVVMLTGGTGLSPRDRTPETIQPMLDMEIPGFGEIFRMLSYQEIGPAAMLSRALAGRIGRVLVFCLPGSTNAVRLANEKLLVPELPHLVDNARAL